MSGRFNPSSPHPARALQAWQILVAHAMNRQTVTYEGLSTLMYGKEAAGVLRAVLGHAAFFCLDNDLPALTSIVVNKRSGAPGDGIPLHPEGVEAERERVYAHDWWNVRPPTERALAESWMRHQSEAAR